jgi:dTDP-4-dehydrorhamnose 3,5-epimerase-like enzyme
VSLINIINFKSLGDARGDLISLESTKEIPFEIKRVYYIFDTQNDVIRGLHAHKELKQVAIVLKGSCRFLLDDGVNKESIILSNAHQGLLIDSCLWREMSDFSEDCVLIVLASAQYDENDYIRNYNEFLKMAKNVNE